MIMSVAAVKLFFFLSIGFATAFPVLLSSEPAHTNSDSIPSAQNESRAIKTVAILQGEHNGNTLFASERWKKRNVTPSRVRESRNPQPSIFDHVQWENPNHPSARYRSLIFARTQLELEEQKVSGEKAQEEDHADLENEVWTRNHAKDGLQTQRLVRGELEFFNSKQWERREKSAGSVTSRRKDISTGPVFFAKIQWEEDEVQANK
ncbi:hypothetical protein C8R43DRAFT_1030692 [Mycena crocata]|nr:hypothetical protein C8R43DRAFT_1030692 [Mycena crocata]